MPKAEECNVTHFLFDHPSFFKEQKVNHGDKHKKQTPHIISTFFVLCRLLTPNVFLSKVNLIKEEIVEWKYVELLENPQYHEIVLSMITKRYRIGASSN